MPQLKYGPPMSKEEWNKGDQMALLQKAFDRHNTQSLTGLTYLQRLIYRHFLAHLAKKTGEPCLLPTYTGKASSIHEFFAALDRLEERELLTVDRSPENYKSWTISGPR